MRRRMLPTPPTYRAMNSFNEANVIRDRIGRFANKPGAAIAPEADAFTDEPQISFDPASGTLTCGPGVINDLLWHRDLMRDHIKKIVIEPGAKLGDGGYEAENCFEGMENLEEVELPRDFLAGQHSTYRMFAGCKNLRKLNTADLDMSQVNNADEMFYDCGKLKTIDTSDWDVGQLISARRMFSYSGIEEFNAPNWNTGGLQNTFRMFEFCTNLESADVSGWDTTSLEEASWMFHGCHNLKSIDTDGWELNNPRTVQGMFKQCQSLPNREQLIAYMYAGK